MNSDNCKFDCQAVFIEILRHWNDFMMKLGTRKCVIGISGGADSTVVAALAAKIHGPENVYGVMLPCGEQSDIEDSKAIIKLLGIKSLTINIGDAFSSIRDGVENNAIEVSDATRINLPPRLRTAALYAVAQSVGGVVINTSNLSEDTVGYCTLWGDDCGSYAPIQKLTKTEVIALGDWLGLPQQYTHKTPADGLQGSCDEERLGMKYADIDAFIREGKGDMVLKKQVWDKYAANKFKLDMVKLPGPEFDLPNHVVMQ